MRLAIVTAMILAMSVACATEPVGPKARQFASDLGLPTSSITCQTQDSNRDGYVSCALNDGTKLVAFECSYLPNSGCRLSVDRD
jgi:hypothetical protein